MELRHLRYFVTVAEEHDSAPSLIAVVEAGRGVAIVPQSLACLAGPRLKLRPVTPPPAPLVVGALVRASQSAALAALFVEGGRP